MKFEVSLVGQPRASTNALGGYLSVQLEFIKRRPPAEIKVEERKDVKR